MGWRAIPQLHPTPVSFFLHNFPSYLISPLKFPRCTNLSFTWGDATYPCERLRKTAGPLPGELGSGPGHTPNRMNGLKQVSSLPGPQFPINKMRAWCLLKFSDGGAYQQIQRKDFSYKPADCTPEGGRGEPWRGWRPLFKMPGSAQAPSTPFLVELNCFSGRKPPRIH